MRQWVANMWDIYIILRLMFSLICHISQGVWPWNFGIIVKTNLSTFFIHPVYVDSMIISDILCTDMHIQHTIQKTMSCILQNMSLYYFIKVHGPAYSDTSAILLYNHGVVCSNLIFSSVNDVNIFHGHILLLQWYHNNSFTCNGILGHPVLMVELYLRNNLGFCQVCREITAEGLLITSWGSSAAEGGYQISPRRLFHAQTWQKAQIIPIIIYWASYVSMF